MITIIKNNPIIAMVISTLVICATTTFAPAFVATVMDLLQLMTSPPAGNTV